MSESSVKPQGCARRRKNGINNPRTVHFEKCSSFSRVVIELKGQNSLLSKSFKRIRGGQKKKKQLTIKKKAATKSFSSKSD